MPPADGRRVRIARRRRVRVANPEQPAVRRHDQIGVLVVSQKRRDRRHAIGDVPVVEHAAFGGDVVAEQNLQRLESEAEQQLAAQTADAHAVGAAVDRLDVLPRPSSSEIPSRSCSRARSCSSARRNRCSAPSRRCRRHRRLGRDVLDEQNRQPFRRHLVHRPERDAVAVGEGQVLVDPRAVRAGSRSSARAPTASPDAVRR